MILYYQSQVTLGVCGRVGVWAASHDDLLHYYREGIHVPLLRSFGTGNRVSEKLWGCPQQFCGSKQTQVSVVLIKAMLPLEKKHTCTVIAKSVMLFSEPRVIFSTTHPVLKRKLREYALNRFQEGVTQFLGFIMVN